MKPSLALKAPDELTIFYNGRNDHVSNISGQVSGIHMQSLVTSIDAHVHLLRIGRFKDESYTGSDQTCERRLKFFRPTSQFNWADVGCAEKVRSCPIHFALDPKSRKAFCDFQLKVPAHLPPTTSSSSIEISYAIIVSAKSPCGQVLRSGQLLRISRKPVEPVRLQTTPIAYSQSTLSLRVSFEPPNPRCRSIAATLHLWGLSGIPLHSSQAPLVRGEEMLQIVPQMIQWEVEEKSIVEKPSDQTGLSPILRSEIVRIVKRGIHRSIANFPLQTVGNERPDFDAAIPFRIDIPEEIDFPSPLGAMECLLDTWSCEHLRCEKARFALYTEHHLRVQFQMCGDMGSEGHRKPDWYTYTAVLPLRGLTDTLQDSDGVMEACQEQYRITRIPSGFQGPVPRPNFSGLTGAVAETSKKFLTGLVRLVRKEIGADQSPYLGFVDPGLENLQQSYQGSSAPQQNKAQPDPDNVFPNPQNMSSGSNNSTCPTLSNTTSSAASVHTWEYTGSLRSWIFLVVLGAVALCF